MKKLLVIIVVAFLVQHYGHTQSLFDPTWAGRFQEVLDSVVAADNIMGATAAVLAPGEGIWSGISGNSMPGVPLTPEMRFGIGSNTKLFIAVTMAKLQEEGLLSLDDPLYQWLPAYPHIDSSITIRQLLSHQSGIYNFTDNNTFWNAVYADTAHFWTPQEILGYVLAPNFEPGTGWRYSNTNYILAAMIIDTATGQTWVQKLHEIIFDPLDMDSTFVGAYESANGPIAAYQWWGGGGPWFNYPVTSYFSSCGSAGAILSTGKEMVQWYNALIGGEILSDSSLQQILDFEAASSFGLGIIGTADESLRYPWYDHGGDVFTHHSQVIFDIKTTSVFFIVKNSDPWETLPDFINLMMEILYYEYPKKQNDAGIIQITNPGEHVCTETVIPQVILKNFGSIPLTSVSIYCKLDSGNPSMFPWTGNLSSGDTISLPLEAIIPGNGFHTLTVCTSAPNNASDGYPYNDTTSMHFIENLPPSTTFPLVEGFEDPEFPAEGWISVPDIFMQWGRTLLTSFTGAACAAKCNYWDFLHIGAQYNLDLPMVNLNGINNPMLYFTYAYTAAPPHFDTLKIQISTDCGSNWQTLFYKGGYDLRTAPYNFNPFFPKTGQWHNEIISLEGYTSEVIIRFQDICGNGNNLFLDDVRVDYATSVDNEKITNYELRITNWPNPFGESTTFSYRLKEQSLVTLQVFNSFGQLVAEPLNNTQITGEHNVQWDTGNLPAGIYFYRIHAGSQVGSGKMIKN